MIRMTKLVESRKAFLEFKITELNQKYIFGEFASDVERNNIKKQIDRYEKELMRLNNAVILNVPVGTTKEKGGKHKLSLYKRRKG